MNSIQQETAYFVIPRSLVRFRVFSALGGFPHSRLDVFRPKGSKFEDGRIGIWLVDPSGENSEIGKNFWYLVRYADGSYRYQRIWDEKNPLTNVQYGLRGYRGVRPSPFPGEAGRV